jgi:membrane-bound lytic murein transglycosylase A
MQKFTGFCLSVFCLALIATTGLTISGAAEESVLPLRRVEESTHGSGSGALGFDDRLWDSFAGAGDRRALLEAIDHSLVYLHTSEARTVYTQYPVAGFSRDRVIRTLRRFRQLLLSCTSAAELQAAVLQEFDLYQSVGADGAGTVGFTGYFEPVYEASRTPTAEFRYPIYRLPPDLPGWPQPHPPRQTLEGKDGLQGERGRLRGLALAWLRDRLEAYLVQVQGSARLQLTDGTMMSVGYAGRTDYPYVSLGRELVKDGKVAEQDLSLPVVISYFRQHPTELDEYVTRNDRFVFFQETTGSPASGSLGVPVTADRSIATDKSLMPAGALALIQTQIPELNARGELVSQRVNRYVLDQDTGGAIRGAGRVDIFMGTGELAGDRAGLINSPGQLYYLLLRE